MMGGRGRLVVPAEVRGRAGLDAGTPLLLSVTPGGLVLMTRAQARAMLQQQLLGADLVQQLLTDRRAATAAESRA